MANVRRINWDFDADGQIDAAVLTNAPGGGGGGGFSATIGDGVATTFVVNHALSTRDVVVSVYRNSAPYDEVTVGVDHTDDNNVTLDFGATVPTTNEYAVFVTSGGGGGSSAFSQVLTANTTVNVNNFTELENEINTVIPGTFLNGFDYTVQCADGTYTFTGNLTYAAPVGNGTVIIQGNNSNITLVDFAMGNNVLINQSGNVQNCLRIKDLQMSGNTTVQTLQIADSGIVELDNVKFATTTTNNLVNMSRAGKLLLFNGIDIQGISMARFINCNGAASIVQARNSMAINVTGSTWTSQFVRASDLAYIRLDNSIVSYTGSATGSRFDADFNGVIQTNSGGAPTTLPGNAVGTTANGGLYN